MAPRRPTPDPRRPRRATCALLGPSVRAAARAGAVGAGAGALATLPMSAVLLGGRRAGLVGRPPPGAITGAAERAVGTDPSSTTHRVMTTAAHVGFGAAAGVPVVLLHRAARRAAGRTVPATLLGAVYGVGVWASAYLGWVPAVGVLPPAHRDRPDRQLVMVLAHVVYGAVLGRLTAPAGHGTAGCDTAGRDTAGRVATSGAGPGAR